MWQTQAFWPGELWSKPDSGQKYEQCIDLAKRVKSEFRLLPCGHYYAISQFALVIEELSF